MRRKRWHGRIDKPHKLLIVAGDTDGNLGDRAIVLSMCDAFRKLRPEIQMALMSRDPARDRHFFPGTQLIPRGPQGLAALLKCACSSDLVLCGGGGLFQDDDSLVKMPYWALRLLLLRLCCRRIVGYSIGAGPLVSGVGRLFARLAFACMERVTVRDREALESCRGLTARPLGVLPDPALLTAPAANSVALKLLRQSGVPVGDAPIIGAALRRWFHHRKNTWIPHKYAHKYRLRRIPERPEYHRMTALIAEVLDELVETFGAYVLFLPTYNLPHESDARTCRQVLEKMQSRRAAVLKVTDPRLYKAVAGQLSVMLGGRMHPTILAAGAGTPVVGLSYNQKFKGFLDLLGIGERVLDVETFVTEQNTRALYALLADGLRWRDGVAEARVRQLSEAIHVFNESLLKATGT